MPVPLLPRLHLVARLAECDRPLRPGARGYRRPAAEQGVHHLAPLPRAGSLLHQADGARIPAGQPGHHAPALAPGAAVHRPEHPDLGLGPGRHGTAGHHALVQVGGARRLGHRCVPAHSGEDARFQLGDVGDDEPPAHVGDRRRAASGWGRTAHRHRSTPTARSPPHRAGSTTGTARRAPSCPASSSRWPAAAVTASCTPAAPGCRGDRAARASRTGCRLTGSPAACSARSTPPGESAFRAGARKAVRISASSRSSASGRRPAAGRGPSSSVSRRSCTSARHGSPAWVISAAASAPEDSAATSRPSRPRSAEAASAACWRSCSAAGSSRSAGSSSGNRAGSVAVTGCSASHPAVSSSASTAWSTNGDRRRIGVAEP